MPYVCPGEIDTSGSGVGMGMAAQMKCPYMIVRNTDTVCEMDRKNLIMQFNGRRRETQYKVLEVKIHTKKVFGLFLLCIPP